jgi:hypothetical protein
MFPFTPSQMHTQVPFDKVSAGEQYTKTHWGGGKGGPGEGLYPNLLCP